MTLLASAVSGFVAALTCFWTWRIHTRTKRLIADTRDAERTLDAAWQVVQTSGPSPDLADQMAKELQRDTKVGLRLRVIGALLPEGEEWRIEEMKNHRNEMRAELGKVPGFHYVRLFLSTLELRWEARAYPERRVD